MSVFDNPDQFKLLRDLLNPQDAAHSDLDSGDEDEVALARLQKFTPADIGKDKKAVGKNAKNKEQKKDVEKLPQNIEEWQKMQEAADAEILDTRKAPTYSLVYRQAVGTEDVFFQMNNRSNASASCEDMIVEILMPEESVSADKMDLSICEQEIDLSTPIYHLKLPLPHPINCDRSRAKYDVALKKLTLTLRLKRELDFVNF